MILPYCTGRLDRSGPSSVAIAAVRDRITMPETRPLSWEVVVDAAAQYNLPLAAMVGILATEGGKQARL